MWARQWRRASGLSSRGPRRIDLFIGQSAELIRHSGDAHVLRQRHEVFAPQGQFLGEFEDPDLFVLFFHLRLRQAVLPVGVRRTPQSHSRPTVSDAGSDPFDP